MTPTQTKKLLLEARRKTWMARKANLAAKFRMLATTMWPAPVPIPCPGKRIKDTYDIFPG